MLLCYQCHVQVGDSHWYVINEEYELFVFWGKRKLLFSGGRRVFHFSNL